jgi:hypothetical protein
MYTSMFAAVGGSVSCVALAAFGTSVPVAGGFFIAMVCIGLAIDATRGAKHMATK